MSDYYTSNGKTIYLMLLLHQHQPFYFDPEMSSLIAPWVRTHTTKDYLKIPSLLKKYPNVHITINLTPSLIIQIQEHYLRNFKYVLNSGRNINKRKKKNLSVELLLDLLLKPTDKFTSEDIYNLYNASFNALSVNEVVRHHFPEYDSIHKIFSEARSKNILLKNTKLLRELKFWFTLVNFDLDILEGPIKLPDSTIIDLSDYVLRKADYKYYLRKEIKEEDCHRLAGAIYQMMSNFLAIHKQLLYNSKNHTGQIELSTSPYSHPIIPLIYDTDSSRSCMREYELPKRFHFPDDAELQVKMGIEIFKKYLGFEPSGIWPSEGAVSNEAVKIFSENKFLWFATDMQILYQTFKKDVTHLIPYNVHIEGKNIAGFFRDTTLSDKISFKYQNFDGEESADDFIKHLLSYADTHSERIVSVIMDGENAWEWYKKDFGAREFLNALFRKLEKLYHTRQIVTVTPTEYIMGNLNRGIDKHPIEKFPVIKNLACGSWIHGNFSKWIGQEEKNEFWEILLQVRNEIKRTNISFSDLLKSKKNSKKEKYLLEAYEYLFMAEGSDWFWWAGEDQESFAKKPFNEIFYNYIKHIYINLFKAGYKVHIPEFKITKDRKYGLNSPVTKVGSMKEGRKKIRIKFICDATNINVTDAIYITGNIEELGEWIPNLKKMKKLEKNTKESLWEYEIQVDEKTEIQYKYTNSGKPGEWGSSEEFPAINRHFIAKTNEKNYIIVKDKFGKL